MIAIRSRCALLFAAFCAAVLLAAPAHADLTITPITWNIIGLDSNSPLAGPNRFPVGARVCTDVATTNVSVQYVWDSANPYVNLRSGSLSTINFAAIPAGECRDAYFEVEVVRDAAAFDTTRRYHITATDASGSVSTPQPRELYIEHLISQSRNSIDEVKYGPDPLNLTTVAPGDSMALLIGNTYTIQLIGGTATQGYNQFEAFINFPNTIFQVLDVETTYSANNSPYVSGPAPAIHDRLYADACLWDNDPNSPTYRECVGGDFKSGGSNVVTTYTIRIVGGGGTSQTLNSLLYDFSGSSYHYNADYATGARIANIIDPTTAGISKTFNPSTTALNGISTLTFTLTNPNPDTLAGYNFVDNLPANLVVASNPATSTSGCGSPTLSAAAGSSTISFSNGTLAANSSCVITVNVTPSALGTLVNTTNNLFIGTLNTNKSATANLTVNNAPPPGTGFCGLTLARWNFETGMSTTAPAATVSNVSTSAAIGAGLDPQFSTTDNTIAPAGTGSWSSNGDVAAGNTLTTSNDDYFEFGVNTTGLTAVYLTFDALFKTPNGPKGIAVYYGTSNARPESGTQLFLNADAMSTQNAWVSFGAGNTIGATTGLNPSGLTYFRIYGFNAPSQSNGADLNIDNVLFTGCQTAQHATMAKSFAPDPIAAGQVSTLTFTLTNPNATALTAAAFTDALPAGVQVAATPSAGTTCAGATWAPAAGATSLTFSGGTIPASGSCTASVNVTALTSGPHANASGFLSTTQSGTNTNVIANAMLTAVLPPSIDKQFNPSPILPSGVSTLTFLITNPNQDDALSGVAFGDVFPGSMVVAPVPNATLNGCGAPTYAPAAGAGSISFSGGALAAGGTCIVTVDVTAPTTGPYPNVSGAVSHIINAQTVNGNNASDTLEVVPPDPSISLLKQIAPAPGGPWTTYLPVAPGSQVHYRFTVENTGDVPLTDITLIDDTLNVASCNAAFTGLTLPVAVAANENHIVTCIVGPVPAMPGMHTNSATAEGTYSGTPYASLPYEATYATTGLTLDKTSASTFTSAGDPVNYSYLVTNSGAAILAGPVTVADDKTTVTCPAVSSVGDLDNFLEPSESIICTATYNVTAGDVAAGFVTNTATATAQGVNSNGDSVTVVATTTADVSITKTLDTAGPFTAGQSVTYTLTVANGGPSTATNISVTDTPANLTITNVSGACVALPCTIASLATGANSVITVTATITAAGAFDNVANADADQTDPFPANNTDDTGNGGNTGAPSADVSLSKTLDTPGPFAPLMPITYTIVVTNDGPSTANMIQVTDTPTNVTIDNVSGACATLPCTITSLLSGTDATITVNGHITAVGAFDNSANADATEDDPNPANNTDNSGNGGTAASADLVMVKTLGTAGPFAPGQSVTYTLTITNNGPSTANGIDVTDTPTNLTITNVSGACVALPCTISSIAPAMNASITVTATITSAGAFDNAADAFADESDPNIGNNVDNSGNGGNAPSADVSLTKNLNTAPPYMPGQSITYTLQISNAGPQPANNIDVTDTPANLTITNVSGACVALPCTIASLAPMTNTSITVTATIGGPGPFDNAADAFADEQDPTPANNVDNSGNGGNAPSANVSLTKTLNTAGPYTAGQSVTYTLLIANGGPSTATNIDVTDTPANLTITNVSGACVALPCTIASLANGASTSITVTATIVANGAFDNAADAFADEHDSNLANNTDSSGNGGTAAAVDLVVTKTLLTAGPFTPGQSVSYSIAIQNLGPSTATGIDVADTPANLTITIVSGACVALPCTIASIANGATATINVTATIVAVGAFDNGAAATPDEFDTNVANNADASGNGGTAASADVSVTKTLATAGPYTAGQSVTYTLVIANAGPSTATGIDVTDTPTNLTITNVSGACVALPCTIASLASGADATITITATIAANGAFDNVAAAAGDEPDPDSGDNNDSTGNNGSTESADVSLVKTLTTTGPYSPGQSITYTLQISNAGPSTATGIDVTDTVTNLTITNVSGACPALPCTIASLGAASNASITVTATINAAGAFDNSATALADQFDPNAANNTDSTGNGGNAISADVSLVKTLTTAGPYSPGQSITYALQIANAGPSTATGIDVTDTPTNLTITNVSGACTALPCAIASLGAAASTSITVTATITAAGAFDNSATALGDELDPNGANNTDSTGNGGNASSADVSLVKTLTTAGPYSPGQSITYTLQIANAGPSTATNIDVTDTPTNLTITSVSGACVALPCTIASLGAAANTSITVTATITAAGAFDNSATALGDELDPNGANNTDSTGNGGNAISADVSLVKTLTTAGPYSPGQSITYTLQIANAGPSTATGIDVTDTPTNLTITNVSGACTALPCAIASLGAAASTSITVTATITAAGAFDNAATALGDELDPNGANNTDSTGNGGNAISADVSLVKTLTTAGPYSPGQSITYTLQIANAGPSTATNIDVTDTPTNLTITSVSGACVALPCTIASLGAATNTSITVTATITAAGAFDNVATALGDEHDPNLANNTDADGNNGLTGTSADVSLVKTLITAGPFSSNQTVSYTLAINNAGPSPATNIDVTDTPSNLTITNVSGACTALPCTIASLASGANTSITVTATIDGSGAFDNVASAFGDEPDPTPANNTDADGNGGSAGTMVDLAIVKTSSVPQMAVGDTFSFTLVVTNNGPDIATNVVVVDPLPANFSLLGTSTTQGSCGGTTTVTCLLGTMNAGATVTITINGRATAPGTLQNTASVDSNESEAVTANNSSTATPMAVAATAANVPTASEWGLAMLAMLLAMAGVVAMRR